MRNLPKIFLRRFANVAPGLMGDCSTVNVLQQQSPSHIDVLCYVNVCWSV